MYVYKQMMYINKWKILTIIINYNCNTNNNMYECTCSSLTNAFLTIFNFRLCSVQLWMQYSSGNPITSGISPNTFRYATSKNAGLRSRAIIQHFTEHSLIIIIILSLSLSIIINLRSLCH